MNKRTMVCLLGLFLSLVCKGIVLSAGTNGAVTQDLNKGISAITYNILNLPQMIDIKNPSVEGRNEYTYSAAGVKLKAVQKWNPSYSTAPVIGSTINTAALTQSATTDYIGNIIYENGALKRILIDGGYIDGGIYYYYIRDHLGNNRIVANAVAAGVQSTQYYPFGAAFADAAAPSIQPYKYNNKEFDMRNTLNMYDYLARLYDPSFPHFLTPDQLAEKRSWESLYCAMANNPLRFVDPDGRDIWDFLLGTVHSINSNLSLGLTNTSTEGVVSDAGDYNKGRDVGDVISMAMGVVAMDIGGGAAAGGAVATVGTAGGASPVSVPVTLAGAGFAIYGAATATKAAKSLMSQDGRISQAEATRGNENQSSSNNSSSSGGGTQVNSKTLWKDSNGKGRIDVENPAPGKRPGQVHYQDGKGGKYVFDSKKGIFMEKNSKTGKYTEPAPNYVNKQLENKDFKQAVDKGLNYLGE